MLDVCDPSHATVVETVDEDDPFYNYLVVADGYAYATSSNHLSIFDLDCYAP